MKRRMNKRMAAATLAGAMVLSMNGMAWAAEVTEFNLTKEVTTDGKTHAPNTAFIFTITEGNEGTLGAAKVYAGVPGGLIMISTLLLEQILQLLTPKQEKSM